MSSAGKVSPVDPKMNLIGFNSEHNGVVAYGKLGSGKE